MVDVTVLCSVDITVVDAVAVVIDRMVVGSRTIVV